MIKTVLLDYNPFIRLFNNLTEKVSILGQTSNYLRSLLFNKDDKVLEKMLFLIGCTALTLHSTCFIGKLIKKWGWIPGHLMAQSKVTTQNLKERYGDCYVLITGFTSGIGLAYAQIFAKHGFNLLLVSRNEENVKRRVEELEQKYKNISIKSFSADLAKVHDIKQLEGYFNMFRDLDIGIVVNNAGSVTGGMFPGIPQQQIINDVNCDVISIFNINRILIPKLRARNKRSAIINISSGTGVYLTGRVGVYSSAKLILDVYSRVLSLENKDKMDVISMRPFGVTTKMMKMKKGPFMISPRAFAKESLGELLAGHDVSFGHSRHKAMVSLAFEGKNEEESFKVFDALWDAAKVNN